MLNLRSHRLHSHSPLFIPCLVSGVACKNPTEPERFYLRSGGQQSRSASCRLRLASSRGVQSVTSHRCGALDLAHRLRVRMRNYDEEVFSPNDSPEMAGGRVVSQAARINQPPPAQRVATRGSVRPGSLRCVTCASQLNHFLLRIKEQLRELPSVRWKF